MGKDDVKRFNLTPIEQSGISVKLPSSKHYTIAKLSPSTFKSLFQHNILAAGASLYYRKKKKLKLNPQILKAWGVEEKAFFHYYGVALQQNVDSLSSPNCQKCLKKIKRYAKKEIANRIKREESLSDFIFKGVGNFQEPFTAPWIYVHGELKQNGRSAFQVTTGSGRSHGHYSIVIKPKKYKINK